MDKRDGPLALPHGIGQGFGKISWLPLLLQTPVDLVARHLVDAATSDFCCRPREYNANSLSAGTCADREKHVSSSTRQFVRFLFLSLSDSLPLEKSSDRRQVREQIRSNRWRFGQSALPDETSHWNRTRLSSHSCWFIHLSIPVCCLLITIACHFLDNYSRRSDGSFERQSIKPPLERHHRVRLHHLPRAKRLLCWCLVQRWLLQHRSSQAHVSNDVE